jgi:hypothetical protein
MAMLGNAKIQGSASIPGILVVAVTVLLLVAFVAVLKL